MKKVKWVKSDKDKFGTGLLEAEISPEISLLATPSGAAMSIELQGGSWRGKNVWYSPATSLEVAQERAEEILGVLFKAVGLEKENEDVGSDKGN